METRLNVRPVGIAEAGRHLADLACYQSGELIGAALFLVELDTGEEVGAYALKQCGSTGWLLAGAGALANHDATAEFLPAVEEQLRASGCKEILIRTARPGLIYKLDRAGYRLDSTILKKSL